MPSPPGCHGCGGVTSTPGTGRRCRIRRCWLPRSANSSTTSRGNRPPGAGPGAGRWRPPAVRTHPGLGHRCRQRHRPRPPRSNSPPREPKWCSAISTKPRPRRPRTDRPRGGIAHAYPLDVADAAAVERFADQVCAAHGVPDIVVNNAGVGHGGNFLDTPADRYGRGDGRQFRRSGQLLRGFCAAHGDPWAPAATW